MPEAWLHTRWPDQQEDVHYSPSSVIGKHFTAGESYDVTDFVARARRGLQQASDRVKLKHGFSCTRAAASLAAIEQRAAAFAGQADAHITILEITS
jgi:uncharacterized repeat protein (TIGR04042 family)